MKQNKIKSNNGRRNALVILTVAAVVAVIVGVLFSYDRLHGLWLEQCVVHDVASQVSITSGRMVKADVIAENFGLTNGANLAQIDFSERRDALLRKVPNLRSISVTRHLPDRVTIVTEERTPIARMGLCGQSKDTCKVVDADGVVFICARGTRMLPIIREAQTPGTATGQTLTGRARAALQLIETVRDPNLAELGVLEVDVSKPDYLQAVLGDYSRAKIAWDGMDDPSPAKRDNLVRQLSLLLQAIRSRIGEGAVIWNATDTTPGTGYIYADGKGRF